MKIDYEFYITNQIMKPALQFLELVIPDAAKLFNKYKETFKQERMEADMKESGQVKLALKKCKDRLDDIGQKLMKLTIRLLTILSNNIINKFI